MKSLLDIYLALAAAIFYLLATTLGGLDALIGRRKLARLSRALTVVGVATHTAALVARGVAGRDVPLSDLFEYTLFLSWALALAYLAVFRKRLGRAVRVALLAVLFLLLGASLLCYTDPAGGKMPALKSYWLYIHVSLAALGETFFAVGFVASLVYLARSRTLRPGRSPRWMRSPTGRSASAFRSSPRARWWPARSGPSRPGAHTGRGTPRK